MSRNGPAGRAQSLVQRGVLVGAVLCGTAWGTTSAVDDSASQVLDQNIRMEWETVVPGRRDAPYVIGDTTVIVRLNVAQWRGAVGRIFMFLPARPEAPILAEWRTRGRLLPGSLRSGGRTIVFAGQIDSNMLEDTLVLRIRTDGELLQRVESLDFRFEIEVDDR